MYSVYEIICLDSGSTPLTSTVLPLRYCVDSVWTT
nr:MAG TPA_asm: hypothetical protein [Caudoviricetes sp.]